MVVPKFANPHSLSQDVERTTRSDIAQRAGLTSIAHDEVYHTLKRDLDTLLQDTWADAFAEASNLSRRARKHRNIADEDDQLAFRLLSSMKRPQRISLDAKPLPAPVSREPDCEDDKTQAETRKKRALSVAVEIDSLGEVAVSTIDCKVPAIVGVNVPISGPLPPLLVTEKARTRKAIRPANASARDPESSVPSPHEPRMSCTVLPVTSSVPDQREIPCKNRRKPARERPPPAYWRPSPGLRGKCLGYALGYPSSWAPDRRYVRDTMK